MGTVSHWVCSEGRFVKQQRSYQMEGLLMLNKEETREKIQWWHLAATHCPLTKVNGTGTHKGQCVINCSTAMTRRWFTCKQHCKSFCCNKMRGERFTQCGHIFHRHWNECQNLQSLFSFRSPVWCSKLLIQSSFETLHSTIDAMYTAVFVRASFQFLSTLSSSKMFFPLFIENPFSEARCQYKTCFYCKCLSCGLE